MGKSVVMFYSLLILAQSFNINTESILKLSALIEHAHYHKDAYDDNFITFLSEHYGGLTSLHKNQHQEHKDLPFKDHHHMLCHVNSLFTFNHSNYYIVVRHFFEKQPQQFFYQELFSSFEKSPIFQPPKIS